MNAKPAIASLFLLVSASAFAQEPATLPPVQVQAVLQVLDCEARVLPSQRQVGEWTGQHNFARVYATRTQLMGEVARACQRKGVEQVQIVSNAQAAPRDSHLVAIVAARRH